MLKLPDSTASLGRVSDGAGGFVVALLSTVPAVGLFRNGSRGRFCVVGGGGGGRHWG